jgi:hypothetical protein
LLVGLFPKKVAVRPIERLCATFGAVESVTVAPAAANPKCFIARVQFVSPADAERAVADLDRAEFAGQRIIVRWAERQPEAVAESATATEGSSEPLDTESEIDLSDEGA